MYTWGYIKDATLSKLDLEEEEAETMNFLRRFVFYANEAMTQICSTVMPKRTFYTFEVTEENQIVKMPEDFISFGDDVNVIEEDIGYGTILQREAFDEDFKHHGYNELMCHKTGKYSISYNARWITFATRDNLTNSGQDDDTVLDAPVDVLECLPSYIAAQCMKVDDEYKASVFRNEYEILLSRIDNTDFKSNKTLTIGGDW